MGYMDAPSVLSCEAQELERRAPVGILGRGTRTACGIKLDETLRLGDIARIIPRQLGKAECQQRLSLGLKEQRRIKM